MLKEGGVAAKPELPVPVLAEQENPFALSVKVLQRSKTGVQIPNR